MKYKSLIIIIMLLGVIIPPVQSQPNWTIDGTRVYTDTAAAYIEANPHTLTSSGWVTFTVISKQYTGSVDLIFGFPDGTKPTKAQYWGLGTYTTLERVLSGESVSYNPYTDETTYFPLYSLIPVEQTRLQWNDWSPDFNKISKDYLDMNTWYYLPNKQVSAGITYTIRI